MNIVRRGSRFSYFDLPEEFANYIFDSRDCVLIKLVAFALELNRVTLTAKRAILVKHVTRWHRLNIAPVVVTSNQPAESRLRGVEQKLFPVIPHAFILVAAHHKPHDHLLHACELAARSYA